MTCGFNTHKIHHYDIIIIIIINVKIIVTLSRKMLQGHCTKLSQNLQLTLHVQQIDSAIMSGLQKMP